MTALNLHQVKSSLSAVARRIKAGETIVICDRNKPFAEIRPLPGIAPKRPKRRLGLLAGACTVPADFNAPDREFESAFRDGPVFPPVPVAPSEHSAPPVP